MKVLASKIGKVYLVGAGPGDPDLLTLKGARCLGDADVVIYDRLVNRQILELAPAQAERIFVGKKGGHYGFPQEKINELLVRRARQGKTVVRLKGGDPFLLGRGGEEALHLAGQRIAFEVVPGVSSAVAVPASAGIPVTHRGVSRSVCIVTGHEVDNSESSVKWAQLAQSADTLVVLMPLKNLRRIVSKLILHGWALDTPAALIESGTLENQREIIAPLRSIAARAAQAHVQSPALLVVGETVALSKLLTSCYQTSRRAEGRSSLDSSQGTDVAQGMEG